MSAYRTLLVCSTAAGYASISRPSPGDYQLTRVLPGDRENDLLSIHPHTMSEESLRSHPRLQPAHSCQQLDEDLTELMDPCPSIGDNRNTNMDDEYFRGRQGEGCKQKRCNGPWDLSPAHSQVIKIIFWQLCILHEKEANIRCPLSHTTNTEPGGEVMHRLQPENWQQLPECSVPPNKDFPSRILLSL